MIILTMKLKARTIMIIKMMMVAMIKMTMSMSITIIKITLVTMMKITMVTMAIIIMKMINQLKVQIVPKTPKNFATRSKNGPLGWQIYSQRNILILGK